ncbi:LacI family DNA-binding transcriptional regulator [Alginatibacterium sediminis]|uniref:LacI family DNA-binding transcriptional regulator n=1 Tax=Alginatibacterium sediminis TaxID=2164068 RepID=A0A420EG46_9ALTE|nr:LacI family transcriptional regulator [Alginatibacterium sediminis]RKF19679.1 LacI family DNA-binding transcriptional regulator [Alginatibacterium sediminis]
MKQSGTGQRPTLKTIAQLSGLAVTTVSRALKDAPDLSDDTKKRIRAIAQEIGYVPDRAGVRLKTGRNHVIAVVLSTSENISDLIGQMVSFLTSALSQGPYHLQVIPDLPTQDAMEAVKYLVQTQSADAIILERTQVHDPRVAYLMQQKVPFVTFGRTAWAEQHPYFDFDNYAFAKLAAEHLYQRKREHLLMIAPPVEHQYTEHLVCGAKDLAASYDKGFTVLESANNDDLESKIMDEVVAHIRRYPQTDGIICASTTASLASVKALDKLKLKLGKDIDLFTKNSSPFLSYFRPEIFTAKEDIESAGNFLAEAAIQAIEKPELAPMQKIICASVG